MKVHAGWVLNINNQECTILGSMKIRGSQSYVLRCDDGKKSIGRDTLLKGMADGSIKYVRSIAI